MRAFVTGGAGFVGRHLGDHLEAMGDQVVSVDLEVDVADPDAIGAAVAAARPEAIYHLAALSHVGESWEFPAEVLRVNVLGTAGVLAAARALPEPAVVLVISSAEVYGSVSADELPIAESSPLRPLSPYAASKAAAEQLALQAWRGYGQPVIVVRPFNHVGPGQAPTFAVSALAKRIVEAQRAGSSTVAVGTLTARRDFTDVRDVVRAYRSLVVEGTTGETYNVCSGHDVAVSQVAHQLCALAGADVELVADPSLVRSVDLPVLRGDYGRLARDTGWRPEIPLEDTLADVLEFWRERVS
ncbi:MAG TPA: GDP-mannose 4,6-dehydratase [Acidimicrobiales bacterium]|nr:GDP-mannose 4,6-dehydratase [Acidimicrobiales bacterium]